MPDLDSDNPTHQAVDSFHEPFHVLGVNLDSLMFPVDETETISSVESITNISRIEVKQEKVMTDSVTTFEKYWRPSVNTQEQPGVVRSHMACHDYTQMTTGRKTG